MASGLPAPALRLVCAWSIGVGAWLLPVAHADEVRVLAAGATQHALERIAPAFEAATGRRVVASYDTVGAQRDRVLAGAAGPGAADMVLLSSAALAQLRAAGRLAPADPVPLGQVVVGLAVPAGQPPPDVSTATALAQTLLAAPSIAYADPARGATAGTHFARVITVLGLADALASKTTVLPFGVEVVQAVAQGRYALGVSQSSEILQQPGVRLAGGLPPPYGLSTPYAAALVRDNPGSRALLAFIESAQARHHFEFSGFLPNP